MMRHEGALSFANFEMSAQDRGGLVAAAESLETLRSHEPRPRRFLPPVEAGKAMRPEKLEGGFRHAQSIRRASHVERELPGSR